MNVKTATKMSYNKIKFKLKISSYDCRDVFSTTKNKSTKWKCLGLIVFSHKDKIILYSSLLLYYCTGYICIYLQGFFMLLSFWKHWHHLSSDELHIAQTSHVYFIAKDYWHLNFHTKTFSLSLIYRCFSCGAYLLQVHRNR